MKWCWSDGFKYTIIIMFFCFLQYALGAAAALLFIYAAISLLRPAVNRVLLVDFSCFTPPQR